MLSTLILLFLMTGSVVLPVKQLLMNVLNLTAVFGILVWIFQDGRLEGFLDYRSDSECVAIGLERTGRIVTAAAVLFAIAVGVFATSEIVFIKENFIGVALAVLIDASIIRALLVPALMELLGRWNWWAPKPLRRLHWRIGLNEGLPEEPSGRPAAGRA